TGASTWQSRSEKPVLDGVGPLGVGAFNAEMLHDVVDISDAGSGGGLEVAVGAQVLCELGRGSELRGEHEGGMEDLGDDVDVDVGHVVVQCVLGDELARHRPRGRKLGEKAGGE